jgi:uncharacterized protein HemX
VTQESASDKELHDRETPVTPENSEPLAQAMTGSVGAQGLTLLAVAVIVILGVVLYGLNGPQQSTGTAPAANAPPAAGNSGSPAPTAPRNGPHAPG